MGTSRRAPDPRVERSRGVILSAALETLAEAGDAGVTIEGVAARAGVGKSTIYRHWGGKLDLLGERVKAGELRPGSDTGLLAECLIGPIVVRPLLLHEPFDSAAVPVLVDQLLPLPPPAPAGR